MQILVNNGPGVSRARRVEKDLPLVQALRKDDLDPAHRRRVVQHRE